MIVSSTRRPDVEGEVHVATALDAIVRLEGATSIRTVVLAGSYAAKHELASFLSATYPAIRIECER